MKNKDQHNKFGNSKNRYQKDLIVIGVNFVTHGYESKLIPSIFNLIKTKYNKLGIRTYTMQIDNYSECDHMMQVIALKVTK